MSEKSREELLLEYEKEYLQRLVNEGKLKADDVKKSEEVKFAQVDKDKRILLGPALIPNKPIFRKGIEEDYYIFFSKDTVKKASELFFVKGNQNKSTLEHQLPLTGLTVVESWIVEDSEKDKTALYDMNLPVGSWMVSMRVDSDEIWNDYIKKNYDFFGREFND